MIDYVEIAHCILSLTEWIYSMATENEHEGYVRILSKVLRKCLYTGSVELKHYNIRLKTGVIKVYWRIGALSVLCKTEICWKVCFMYIVVFVFSTTYFSINYAGVK